MKQALDHKAQQALGLILLSEAAMASKQVKKIVSKKDPKPTFAPVTFSDAQTEVPAPQGGRGAEENP